jgi:hypothetical protein
MCCSHWFWFSLLFIFIFSHTTFTLFHTIPSVSSIQYLIPPSNIFGLSLSLSLSRSLYLWIVCFRSVSLAYVLHSLFCVGLEQFHHPFMFGYGDVPNCSGVSGALEGTSFQNHRPQRTHQASYAKRKSRRRSVGHFIGEHIVDSQSRTLCIYLARAIHCILFKPLNNKIQSSKQKQITRFPKFPSEKTWPPLENVLFLFFTRIGKALLFYLKVDL